MKKEVSVQAGEEKMKRDSLVSLEDRIGLIVLVSFCLILLSFMLGRHSAAPDTTILVDEIHFIHCNQEEN